MLNTYLFIIASRPSHFDAQPTYTQILSTPFHGLHNCLDIVRTAQLVRLAVEETIIRNHF